MAAVDRTDRDVTNEIKCAADDGQCPITPGPRDLESFEPAICVICLDRISDEAVALPCKHDQFHFSCLGTWLLQARDCPLCKREVKGIRYRDERKGPQEVFYLADHHSARFPQQRTRAHEHERNRARRTSQRRRARGEVQQDPALAFRRSIYENKLYSMYVGSNMYSRYRNISARLLCQEVHEIIRAKRWIRRELGVFDFLDPSSADFAQADRKATNAEYLLEYVVAILKSIDLKGSAGQAEELLRDFLGRENARLFLHELEAWLRSPFESLQDWDEATQYAKPS